MILLGGGNPPKDFTFGLSADEKWWRKQMNSAPMNVILAILGLTSALKSAAFSAQNRAEHSGKVKLGHTVSTASKGPSVLQL